MRDLALAHEQSGPSSPHVDTDGDWPSSVRQVSVRPLAPGDVLAGKYELVSLIGEGGMGAVWRAHSLVLDVDIAIKVLRGQHHDVQAAERLLREAQATAAFGHPAIVRAFDFGQTRAGEPFLVMELLQGTSLEDWIRENGRMPATQAVQLLLPIADGLATAHARGIVHRDIKPANLILVQESEGGPCQPKIVDFGIAKLHNQRSQVITEAGTVLGSLEYMAPEQADGKEVGEQADVWSLCVVLYELITGRRPFAAESLASMIVALYTTTPTRTTLLAAGDDELWEIIARGLEKSPKKRWPSMRALGRALAAWARARGVTVDSAGASLDHLWLGRNSDPFGIVKSSRNSSVPPPSSLAMSLEVGSAEPVTPAVETPRSAPSLACTKDTLVASKDPTQAAPRPRGSRLARVAAFLIVAPLLTVAGLRAHGARVPSEASASAALGPVAAARQAPVVVAPVVTTAVAAEPTAAPAVETAPPAPATASSAAASASSAAATVPAKAASSSKPSSTIPRPKRTAPSMPLPSSPGF